MTYNRGSREHSWRRGQERLSYRSGTEARVGGAVGLACVDLENHGSHQDGIGENAPTASARVDTAAYPTEFNRSRTHRQLRWQLSQPALEPTEDEKVQTE